MTSKWTTSFGCGLKLCIPHRDSVEVKVMSLKEVREAAAAVLLFLEENRSSSQAAAREICAELSRMTVTARHVQPSVAELFRRASGSV
jgi:hypothetical protein